MLRTYVKNTTISIALIVENYDGVCLKTYEGGSVQNRTVCGENKITRIIGISACINAFKLQSLYSITLYKL